MRDFEISAIGAFADELRDTLPKIAAALDAAEGQADPIAVGEAHRLLHSLKGAAGMVGLPTLGYLLNLAEDLVEQSLGSPTLTDRVFRSLRASLPKLAEYMTVATDGTATAIRPVALALVEQLRGDADAIDRDTLEKLLEIDGRELASGQPGAPQSPNGPARTAEAGFDVALAALPEETLDSLLAALPQTTTEDGMAGSMDVDITSLLDGFGTAWPSALTLPAVSVEPVFDLTADLRPETELLADLEALMPSFDLASETPLTSMPSVDSLLAHRSFTDRPVMDAPGADRPVTHTTGIDTSAMDADLFPSEEVPPELAEVFAQEATEHLQTIARVTAALSPASDDREMLQELRRAVHTLKGAAGVVGYKASSKLAHVMENLLDRLYEGGAVLTPQTVRLLATASDTLDESINGGRDPIALRTTIARLIGEFNGLAEQAETIAAEEPAAEPAAEPALDVPAVRPHGGEERRQTVDRRAAGQQVLRVPVTRLDDLVRAVSELVLNRSTFEQHYSALLAQVEELKFSAARIRKVAQKLEADYEVRALAGNSLSTGAHGFDELEFDRYTDFHLLTRELTETASDVATVSARVSDSIGDFEGDLTRLGRLTREIQDKTMEFRMLPVRTLTARLERTVRVTADACGKRVSFAIEGEDVTLDKSLLDHMADPLLHLLRNAVDHGIEPVADRRAAGKSESGRIVVRAFHDGTDVVIEVEDDGKGLDVERIRRTAIKRGLVSENEAAGLAPEALFDYIFAPGFSTASQVSEISGRGVGMDVVKSAVVRAGGRIQIDSRPGAGVTISVRAPMTLAITRVLLVRAGGHTFGLPLGAVVQIVKPHQTAISQVGADRVLTVEGRAHRLRDLADVLGLARSSDAPKNQPVLIANLSGRRIALAVDEILHSRDAVVKSLGTHLRRVRGIWGATLLGDGTVVLILNAADLGSAVDDARVRVVSRPVLKPLEPRAYTVLVVDDSLSMRHVLSTTITKAGWNVLQARDGLDALEIVHRSTQPPDAILLDIEMPRMDGYEFLSTIRTHPAYTTLPIVMLTSRGSDKHREKAKALGATGYLVKPFREDVLTETISRLVQTARAAERKAVS